MKTTKFTKLLSVLLCLVLVAAIAFTVSGCTKTKTEEPATTTEAVAEEATKLGEGEKEFTFTVKDADGKETKFLISSNAATVGEALLENSLIAGDQGEYGLYVKTVNGITVDYDTDGKYWAFYVNGEYAQTGVDATELVAGSAYTFAVE